MKGRMKEAAIFSVFDVGSSSLVWAKLILALFRGAVLSESA